MKPPGPNLTKRKVVNHVPLRNPQDFVLRSLTPTSTLSCLTHLKTHNDGQLHQNTISPQLSNQSISVSHSTAVATLSTGINGISTSDSSYLSTSGVQHESDAISSIVTGKAIKHSAVLQKIFTSSDVSELPVSLHQSQQTGYVNTEHMVKSCIVQRIVPIFRPRSKTIPLHKSTFSTKEDLSDECPSTRSKFIPTFKPMLKKCVTKTQNLLLPKIGAQLEANDNGLVSCSKTNSNTENDINILDRFSNASRKHPTTASCFTKSSTHAINKDHPASRICQDEVRSVLNQNVTAKTLRLNDASHTYGKTGTPVNITSSQSEVRDEGKLFSVDRGSSAGVLDAASFVKGIKRQVDYEVMCSLL